MTKTPAPTVLESQTSRRAVLKKAVYVAPVILTLAATPTFAGKGSSQGHRRTPPGRVAGKPGRP